jgi:repressor LexA
VSATTRPALTPKQADVLEWIGEYMSEHLVPPTMREVMERFGFTSTNAVSCHVAPLRKKGYLEPAAGVLRSRGLIPAGLPREEIGRLIREYVAALLGGKGA